MNLGCCQAGRAGLAIVLAAALGISLQAGETVQDAHNVPASITALLPKAAVLDSGDWAVFPTEFGKTFGGSMRAEFPGRPSSCDFTVGPELRVEIKGDTAWEEPPMLDMAVQIHTEDIEQGRTSLPSRLANMRTSNSDVQSVSPVNEEKLANGTILYMEYVENCTRRPNGTNTVLLGYARRGATQFTFDLWISAGAAEAKAMATEMLTTFQQLNIAALTK